MHINRNEDKIQKILVDAEKFFEKIQLTFLIKNETRNRKIIH
jgi:hypothetical protein